MIFIQIISTKVASVFSSVVVAFILLWIVNLFEDLPIACLSSMILVRSGKSLTKVKYLSYYWKVNKIEFVSIALYKKLNFNKSFSC